MSVTQLSSAIHNSSYFPAAIDVAFVKLIHLNDHLDDVKKLGQNLGQTDRQTNRHTGSDVELCSATKNYTTFNKGKRLLFSNKFYQITKAIFKQFCQAQPQLQLNLWLMLVLFLE